MMGILGNKIRAARKAKGWSLGELARQCGMSKTHVWEMERERFSNPSIATLVQLVDALSDHVSLNSLAYAAADDWRDREYMTSAELIARADELANSDNPPVHPVRPVHGEGR